MRASKPTPLTALAVGFVLGTSRPAAAAPRPLAACATTRAQAVRSQAAALARAPRRARPLPPPCLASWTRDGVLVLEDDGTLLRGDHPVDVEGRTLRLLPAPGGALDAAALVPATWRPPTGAPLFAGEWSAFHSVPVTLPFAFPFGGSSYTTVYVTNTIGLFFAPPAPPFQAQVGESLVLYDRTPRITPFLGGESFYGDTAWAELGAGTATFSWVTTEVEVQATLDATGGVTLTWNRLDAGHGAVAAVTGNAGFWATEAPVDGWSDPAGDVTSTHPDAAAVDVTAVELRQVPGTDALRLVLTLAGAPSAASRALLLYDLSIFPDVASTVATAAVQVQVSGGSVVRASAFAALGGATLEVGLPFAAFGVPGRDFEVRLDTWILDASVEYGDEVRSGLRTLAAPGPSVQLDLTADLPIRSARPLYETFTLPKLDIEAVADDYRALFPAEALDGLAVYQNVATDLTLSACAYSTIGNAGADGIGTGSSAWPLEPALLHMSLLDFGCNATAADRMTVLNHELGHHWLHYARLDAGSGPAQPHNPDGVHLAPWVHAPAAAAVLRAPDYSAMGGSYWTETAPGSFVAAASDSGTGYSADELYLMGLAAPGEVPDAWYIDRPVPGFGGQISYWPPAGSAQTGARLPVTIAQLIAAEGPRVPAYPATPSAFRVPFVLVVRRGSFDPAQAATLAAYCREWTPGFAAATLGRASVACAVTCLPPTAGTGNTLTLVKEAADVRARFGAPAGPAPDDYALLEETSPAGPFTTVRASGSDGVAGIAFTPGPAPLLFYRVAARALPDCLGPR